MTTWTPEKRTRWKQTLKQMIKSSGQTQVDVAKEMARRVSIAEGTKVVETSFVAPLSRFVNAKGSEITRWFEQQEERLLPLAQSLRFTSTEPLNQAYQQILLEDTTQTIHHPAFPTVDWQIDWTQCLLQERRYHLTDDFTLALLSQGRVESPVDHPWWKGGQVMLVPWEMVRESVLTEDLEHSIRERVEQLPSSLWSMCQMGLFDALWWLYDLLHHDQLWNDADLTEDWFSQLQSIWSLRLFSSISAQSKVFRRLNQEQKAVWLQHIWATLNPMGIPTKHWLEELDWSMLSVKTPSDLSTQIWTDLRSSDPNVRESAVRELEDWTHPLTVSEILEDALNIGLIIQDEECLFLRDPWIWLPIIEWKDLPTPEQLCVSEVWYPALSWQVVCDDSESLQSLVDSQPQSWWMDKALTWLWLVSSVEVSQIHIDDSVVLIGSVNCPVVDLIQHWLNLLRMAQSRLISGSKLAFQFQHAEILRRYHVFSYRLCSILPDFDVLLGSGELEISRTILEQYAPFQSSFHTTRDWLEQQKRVSYPVWEILKRRAECDDFKSAILLATVSIHFEESDFVTPLEVRLHWLARIPNQTNHLILFQQVMVEYWSGPDPSLPLVLQVAEDIGFDTVLNWMGGWMNPLYWLQNPEEAQTLSRLAIAFAQHFQQFDLLEQWLCNLWDWLHTEASVESGFAIWKGRRVPVQSVNIDLVEDLMADVLCAGVCQCLSSALALTMAKYVHKVPAGDRLSPVCRHIKELLLQKLNPELCLDWIHSAPRVDLDIERMALQYPELLSTLWRLDGQQHRRTDILRLAALLPSIPMWAVREAEKIVYRTGVWPNWLSPFSSEVGYLIPHMMQGERLIDRSWWARVYFKHSQDLSETWPMLHALFQRNVQSHRLKTVYFLSPNSTPMMDCDDLLRWVSSIQRKLPEAWRSQDGRRFQAVLLQYWHVHSAHLSEPQLFMLLSILSKDVSMHELLPLTSVELFWPQLSASGRQVLVNNWLSFQDSEALIRVLNHPLVGSASLHALFVTGHPIVTQRILTRIADGDFSMLDIAMQYQVSTVELIAAMEKAIDMSDNQYLLKAWLIRNIRKWQTRDIHWQIWVRNLLGQK